MVVNNCQDAKDMDSEHNLTTYSDADCKELTGYTAEIGFNSKFMTRDAQNATEYD